MFITHVLAVTIYFRMNVYLFKALVYIHVGMYKLLGITEEKKYSKNRTNWKHVSKFEVHK